MQDSSTQMESHQNLAPFQAMAREQKLALHSIRGFLRSKTSFDVLPVSYRVIVLDTALSVKRALNILLQNGIVSAPLWDAGASRFVGLLTAKDFVKLVASNCDWSAPSLTLRSLATPGPSIDPLKSLYEACAYMLQSSARRIPLVDRDEDRDREIVVSVLTQYRILKFVALNCKETRCLLVPLGDLRIGSWDLVTATLETPVLEAVRALAEHETSSIPVVDADNKLINVYEAVDVLALLKIPDLDLNLCVGEALLKRSDDFEGVYTCTPQDSLCVVLETIRKSRLHRLFIVDAEGRLLGVLTLGDILKYILFQ